MGWLVQSIQSDKSILFSIIVEGNNMKKDIEYIEISRFTYFYENTAFNVIDQMKCQGLIQWSEIEDREQDLGNVDEVLPFTQNLQHFWIHQCISYQTKSDLEQQIYVHAFPVLEKKIFIFETKIKVPFNNFKEGINDIKINRKNIFLKMIKFINPFWHGEYSADNDYFYFFNIKVDSLYNEIDDITERDKKIVTSIQKKLMVDGKCLFEYLGFIDKTFPNEKRLEDALNFIIENEKQPLIVISPAKDANKFIIPDEKIFIRCYQNDSIALPIRLVLKTLLFQKSFIEYASTASINITEDKNSNLSYIELSKAFSKFIDYLWRVEISNSFYLNKAYRIVGRIWLLDSKFEILKNHLDRNSIFEERQYQSKFTLIAQKIIGVLGVYTIISGINDLDQLLTSSGISAFGRLISAITFGFTGVIIIIYVLFKLNNLKQKG